MKIGDPPRRVTCIGGPLDGEVVEYKATMGEAMATPLPTWDVAAAISNPWNLTPRCFAGMIAEYKLHHVAFGLGSLWVSGWCFRWTSNKDTDKQIAMKLVAGLGGME